MLRQTDTHPFRVIGSLCFVEISADLRAVAEETLVSKGKPGAMNVDLAQLYDVSLEACLAAQPFTGPPQNRIVLSQRMDHFIGGTPSRRRSPRSCDSRKFCRLKDESR